MSQEPRPTILEIADDLAKLLALAAILPLLAVALMGAAELVGTL